MTATLGVTDLDTALAALEHAVDLFQSAGLDHLSPREELDRIGRIEVLRRRLDAGTDAAAGHLDRSAAFSLDGHKSAKGALKAIGRLSGSEAHGRVQTARALRVLPLVAAAYARGEIPTAHVRAIARTMSNPRVADHVEGADAIFADAATKLSYDELCAVLRQWEALADTDGTAQDTERTHQRRRASLQCGIDGSWTLEAHLGAAQGALVAEVFDAFETAEFHADWAHARDTHGTDARVEHLARTPAQRRADALVEVFRQAASTPADARAPEPLVNIVIDQHSFEEELTRAAGDEVTVDPNDEDLDRRRCHTIDGTQLHPADVLAAALVGHVRRVVVDATGTVIDLGRKRRLFTGSARDAALHQALLRGPGGLRCLWPGCDGRGRSLQIDHRDPAARGGPTDCANSDAYCGTHNRTKEHGFRPVWDPDGTWTIHRPDGTPITPPA